MQTIDIILAIFILGLGLVQGLRHGFIYQCVTIAAIIGGVWLSYLFADSVGAWLASISNASANVTKVASFVIIFSLLLLGLYLASETILGVLKIAFGEWIDKFLGVIFAIVKTFCFVCIIVYLFNCLNNCEHFVSQEILNNSAVYRLASSTIDILWPRLFS